MAHRPQNICYLVPYRERLPFSVPDSELEGERSLFITKVSIKYRIIIAYRSVIICTVFSYIVFGFMFIKTQPYDWCFIGIVTSEDGQLGFRVQSWIFMWLSAYNHALALWVSFYQLQENLSQLTFTQSLSRLIILHSLCDVHWLLTEQNR